jgi:type I restriction enzyme, S subunit
MSSMRRQLTIGDLCDADEALIQTGPFGSQLHQSDYISTGVRVVATECIGHRRLRLDNAPQVSYQTAERLRRHRLRSGDILFARRGAQATGLSAIVMGNEGELLCSTGAILLRLQSREIDTRFFSFLLSAQDSIEWLRQHAVGVVMPNLNESVLRAFPLNLPPLPQQQAIGRLLGVLDDKIELNRQMNWTLEELATALFRSWFVDFAPVVAKSAGEAPFGVSSKIAALFPKTFTDSELGPIPRGWSVRPIGEVVRAVGGSTPSTGEPRYWSGGNIAWATPRDLSGLSDPVLLNTERQITLAGLERITSGLLPVGTVLLSSRAPIGYTAITETPVAVNQGFIALDCNGPLPNYYIIEWVRENMEVIEGRANGTTFMEISKANFRPIPAIVPTPEVLTQFSVVVGPWWRQIVHNTRESHTLAALRDTLLPKLLSGELHVKDAENKIAAVV